MDEKRFIPVARNFVNGITADIAPFQMVINHQLLIQIQLHID
jgi:hypothetical protein